MLNLKDIQKLNDYFNSNLISKINKKTINEDNSNDKNNKTNIILSDEKQEINLIQNLKNVLKQKELLPFVENLFPSSSNNIFSYLNESFFGMNEISSMRLIMNKNDEEEENYQKDFNLFCLPDIINEYYFQNNNYTEEEEAENNENYINKHILKFRKYIFNLSYTKDSNNDNNIYHIIIPKNYLKNINLKEEKISLFDFCKLPISFYLYKQEPGDLIIIEPECLHFSFCYDKHRSNQIIVALIWNNLKFNSLQDYIILQKHFNKGKLINIPIINMFLNLLNKKGNILNVDILKTIYEIWNDFIKNENLEKYRNLITNDNFFTFQLPIKSVLICQKCGNEIFNYFSYEYNDYNENIYICLNCFFKEFQSDNSFRAKNKILFYKYTKEQFIKLENKIVQIIDERNKISIYNDITNKNQSELPLVYNLFDNELNLNLLDIELNENNNFNINDIIYYVSGPYLMEENENLYNINDNELFSIFNDKKSNRNYTTDLNRNRKENIFDFKLNINSNSIFKKYKEPEIFKKEPEQKQIIKIGNNFEEKGKSKKKIKKASNIADLILLKTKI